VIKKIRWLALSGALAMVMSMSLPASAGHVDDPRTKNLQPKGHILEPASLFFGPPTVHTDIAFWGDHAFQGNWLGFNIRDIADPDNPTAVSFTSCTGPQGDVVVWGDILVRTWDAPAGSTATCDGSLVPQGFEGLHVFDISDLSNPDLIASVPLACGSHTATGVPDPGNNRLLIYSSSSNVPCSGLDIVGIPLDDPAAASFIRFAPAAEHVHCHDTAVILGDAMMAACAGGEGFTLWDVDPANLDDPQVRFSKNVNDEPEISGVTIGHSAGFSWDGEVLIFGHEPGGGVAPRCQATTPETDKTAFFFSTVDGAFLGKWTLPRTQTATENCTIHNYNVVPTRTGKRILVHGSYQSGTSVVDFTDPANAQELAWSDPPPITPTDLGGAWSSYWYNNFIYETNITEGLNIFRYTGRETAGALRLGHLNPQTQEFTLP
jgi:hypothetical protein